MDMNLQQISGHQTATTPKPQELSLVASIVVEQKWDNVSLHVIRKRKGSVVRRDIWDHDGRSAV